MNLSRNGGVARLTPAAVLVAATLSLAGAHGPAEWIQRGAYRNAAGELCCGERDCFELSGEDISITEAGYFAKSIRETVRFSEALPSPAATTGPANGAARASASSHRRRAFEGNPAANDYNPACSRRTKSDSPG